MVHTAVLNASNCCLYGC